LAGSTPVKYNLFSFEVPNKKPQTPEDWQKIPHLHLARLNLRRKEEILGFVNTWGLLGLWELHHKKRSVFDVHHWIFSFRTEDFFNPAFGGEGLKDYLHQFREPLEAFITAAEEFQRFVGTAKERVAYTEGKGVSTALLCDVDEHIFNRYLANCHPVAYFGKGEWKASWYVPSLLHACYLLTWLDWCALRQYRWCEHSPCSRLFVPTRPDQQYCSDYCQNNAARLRHYYRKKETGR